MQIKAWRGSGLRLISSMMVDGTKDIQSVKLAWSTCILRPTPLKEKNRGRKCTCVLRASFV